MRILLLNGSPRKKGNTATLLKNIVRIAEQHSCHCDLLYLNSMSFSGCQSCGGCEKTGRCVVMDDMQLIYEKMDNADRVVLASPIYFYNVSAQLKACIDRIQAFWCRKYLLKQAAPKAAIRKGYLVSVAATKGERIFEGAILTAKYAVDAMGIEYGGEHLIKGMELRTAVAEDQQVLQQTEAFAQALLQD
jgi:multimeric flavodoxin WrbA